MFNFFCINNWNISDGISIQKTIMTNNYLLKQISTPSFKFSMTYWYNCVSIPPVVLKMSSFDSDLVSLFVEITRPLQ